MGFFFYFFKGFSKTFNLSCKMDSHETLSNSRHSFSLTIPLGFTEETLHCKSQKNLTLSPRRTALVYLSVSRLWQESVNYSFTLHLWQLCWLMLWGCQRCHVFDRRLPSRKEECDAIQPQQGSGRSLSGPAEWKNSEKAIGEHTIHVHNMLVVRDNSPFLQS